LYSKARKSRDFCKIDPDAETTAMGNEGVTIGARQLTKKEGGPGLWGKGPTDS